MTGGPRSDAVERFRALVARRLGLAFDEGRMPLLEQVLVRRADGAGAGGVDAYLARIEADGAGRELRALAPELTVGETYFFRNADQFSALEQLVLPERIRARAAERRLRLLSAGCASGEEPYSLSILIHPMLPDSSWDVGILAVDLNAAALERAARGRFSAWALRETPADMERRWFRADGRDRVLSDAARARVRFEQHNLADASASLWQAETYDVIFCRNVLMYFTPDHARGVVERLGRALVPGGYLFLGHAETLRALSDQFHLRHTHGTFYYQRREGDSGSTVAADGLIADAAARTGSPDPGDTGSGTWVERIQQASDRIASLTSARGSRRPPPVAFAGDRGDLGPAMGLLAEERYAEALETVPATRAGGFDRDALLLRAALLTHAGRLREAEEACTRLLEVDELNAGAHYALALCREGAGDARGAIDHDQVAVYLDGSFAMPRLHLGLMARKAGDREAARRELGHALELLQREEPSRVLLFGGGFRREALLALCRAELAACGGAS